MEPNRDPRVYLAVERTFLAWVRTGLALMGFGFVVARFGLFIREIAASSGHTLPPVGISRWFGIALVVIGVILNVASVVRYIDLLRRTERGDELRGPSTLAVSLGLGLALTGSVVIAWLISLS